MNRIHQLEPANSTGKTQELFEVVKHHFGKVPNAIRVLGNSPAALEGYLGLGGALAGGVLPAKVREQLALTVAEINGCGYCLSSHSLTGHLAGLGDNEVNAARRATASDDKSDAILKLARRIALQRGQVTDADLRVARNAGLSDAEIVETVAHVALNTMTNYLNNVARTVVDFPEVKPGHFHSETPVAAIEA
jgi:uncharacterized peroxidase-related enzyme